MREDLSRRVRYVVVGAAGMLIALSLISVFLPSLEWRSPELGSRPSIVSSPNPRPLPEFPWPPRASAFTKIPTTCLPSSTTFRLIDVANRLEGALKRGGYGQTGYYSVPGGFALV